MSQQEEKRQRIYDLLNVETNPKYSLSIVYKARTFFFFTEKELLRKRESGGLIKKRKEGFLTAVASVIKKDPTTSIKKHANELKVHKKTSRIEIKQDLSPDLDLL